jgi:hypothetical protein
MTFHDFTTERVSCFGQPNQIDALIPFPLGDDKRSVFKPILVNEFHFSVVFKCF